MGSKTTRRQTFKPPLTTAGELRKALAELPDDAPVKIRCTIGQQVREITSTDPGPVSSTED